MALRPSATRRSQISMTSLIDVIFLLLLFFMLSSTFTRFAEVQLVSAKAGRGAPALQTPPLFLRLGEESVELNGQVLKLATLPEQLRTRAEPEQKLIVAPAASVTSQRLVDLLIAVPTDLDLTVTVLE